MRTIQLPSGEHVPALGLGTWRMGDDAGRRADEVATLQLAIDLGITLIDTAEMYGSGRSESLVGEALHDRRDKAFLVSKVLPGNASRTGVKKSCEASLRRLRTDRLDLYLLHWRGGVPLEETVAAFEELQQAGKIRHWGVSNFDTPDMQELSGLPAGKGVATNQVLYNLTRRGIEQELLPWLARHRIPTMAYSPIEQARLLADRKLQAFAHQHQRTPAQAALAWVLRDPHILAIPKTGSPDRLRENLQAAEHPLTPEEIDELDRLYPPPARPQALEML